MYRIMRRAMPNTQSAQATDLFITALVSVGVGTLVHFKAPRVDAQFELFPPLLASLAVFCLLYMLTPKGGWVGRYLFPARRSAPPSSTTRSPH